MPSMDEKPERLAEWESDLSDMIVSGSLAAWRKMLFIQVNEMHAEGLISSEEARAMQERVDFSYKERLASL